VLEVDGELVNAEVPEGVELGQVLVDGADDAEPVEDLVGDERRMRVAGAAVLVVVIALAARDVVGEGARHRHPVRPIAGDDVGNVVAHHPAEPATLLVGVDARRVAAVCDVGRSGDADGDAVGVAAGLDRRLPDRGDAPFGDGQVGQLKDEPVGDLAGQLQHPRAVGRDPHVEL